MASLKMPSFIVLHYNRQNTSKSSGSFTYFNNSCVITSHHPTTVRAESHTIYRLCMTLELVYIQITQQYITSMNYNFTLLISINCEQK